MGEKAVVQKLGERRKPKIIAGCPTYDGTRHNATALAQLQLAGCRVVAMQLSNLTRGFNELLCFALNQGASHFLMLHADILPLTPNWPMVLFKELWRHEADVVSAVSPIKSNTSNDTSTAIETDNPWKPRRLTTEEIKAKPRTWTEEGLLVNTGLMLVDLNADWVHPDGADPICFTMHDRIRQDEDGDYIAEAITEDWEFSRDVRRRGGSVYATKAVDLNHVGLDSWTVKWGEE